MSKTAQDYPVTFAYGATDDTYYGPQAQGKPTYVGPYHRGDDHAMPDGTPVVVNGIQIGLSGHTGAASGPHLHIGRFVSGKDTNPNGGGFTFQSAVVTQIGEDAVDGRFVRVQGDGASWVYLHLSATTCSVGQHLFMAVPVPAPAPTPPAPAPAPTPAAADTYTVVKTLKGYRTSNEAANHINPVVDVPAKDYAVFNRANGMVNVTSMPGKAGAWINPADNAPDQTKPANIVYTRLDTPQTLITKLQPTHLWDLGFADDAHATSVKIFDHGTPFIAYGRAQRTDHDQPCYFMTAADFGEADKTGVPVHNQGINTVDLSPAPATTPEPTPAQAIKVVDNSGTPDAEPAPAPTPSSTPDTTIATGTTTPQGIIFTAFMSPQAYTVNQDITIHDYSGTLDNLDVKAGTPVRIGGKFLYKGAWFFRAQSSIDKETWYGFPVTALRKVNGPAPEPTDELEKLMAEADDIRKEIGNLTPHEQAIKQVATVEGWFARLLRFFHKQ